MSTRAWVEATALSAGLAACAVASVYWGVGHGPDAISAVFDPRLGNALWASGKIGLSAGVILAIATPALASAYLIDGALPPRLLVALALASALAPDLIHALVWRALLQPGLGVRWLAEDLTAPAFQCATVGLLLAVKWTPFAAVVATYAAGRRRAEQNRLLRLAGVGTATAFWRAYGDYTGRSGAIAGCVGVLLGLRQHEASDMLFSGGTGFGAEGLSQWTTKVALTFLDPGRASAEILVVILGVLVVIGLASRFVRADRAT